MKTSAAVAGTPAARAVDGRTLLIIGGNGKRISNALSSYCAAVGNLQSGQTVTFTVVDVSDPAHQGPPKRLRLRVP